MHTLTPSLLHRDIKPQNVIVDSFGKCHFIDLGISRFLNSSKTSDTLVMGTRLTAPPEQFGYQQTDLRSDIYSLGILLLYCITGEYKPENAVLMELSEPVRQIVTKATMFDPDKRYQTTEEPLPDLLKARYPSVFSSQPIPIAVPPFRKHSRPRLPYFLLFLSRQAPDWRPAGDSPGKFPFRRRFSRRKTAIPSRNLSSKRPYAPCSTNRKGFSRFPILKK